MGFRDWERVMQDLTSTLLHAIVVRPDALRQEARAWRRARRRAAGERRAGEAAGAAAAAGTPGATGVRGAVVLVGEGRPGDEVVVQLLKLAGGRRARIAVIWCAGACDVPEAFLRFGARHVEALGPEGSLEPLAPEAAPGPGLPRGAAAWRAALAGCGLVFVDGGTDRAALRGVLLDGLWDALRDCHNARVAVAARGAAAALLVGLLGDGPPEPGGLRVWTDMAGFEELDMGAVGPTRRLTARLNMLARALFRGSVAIGVTAGAAAVFGPADEFRVAGDGAVLVVEAQGPARAGRRTARRGAMPALLDLRVQVLPAEYGFDLATRRPIPPPRASKEAATPAADDEGRED